MGDSFDPYFKWLGIPPEQQPPNHYQLLGIPELVDDAEVISNAADRQMAHLRSLQSGDQAALSQRLLNEIAAAKRCLLDPERKAAYDTERQQPVAPPGITPPAQDAPDLKVPPRPTPTSPPANTDVTDVALIDVGSSASVALRRGSRGASHSARGEAARKKKRPVWVYIASAGAAAVVIVIIALLIPAPPPPPSPLTIVPIEDLDVPPGRLVQLDVQTRSPQPLVLDFRLKKAPEGATIDPTSGHFIWQTGRSHAGQTYNILVAVSETGGAAAEEEFLVRVENVDQEEEKDQGFAIEPIPALDVQPGELVQLQLQPRSDRPVVPSWRLSDAPKGATIDPITGYFTWQTGRSHAEGEYRILVAASEAGGAKDEEEFRVRVGTGDRPVDLLKLIDVERDSVHAKWILDPSGLISPNKSPTTLEAPFAPDGNYQVRVRAEHVYGTRELNVGLAVGESQIGFVCDGWNRRRSGLASIDGRYADQNESTIHGAVTGDSQMVEVMAQVGNDRVTVYVNGIPTVDFTKGTHQLKGSESWKPRRRGALFLWPYKSTWRIKQWEVTALPNDQPPPKRRLGEEEKVTYFPLPTDRVEGPAGVAFQRHNDRSVLATGIAPDKGTYTVWAKPPPGEILGIRIEALPDPSLPRRGPGRARDGNFVISDVRVLSPGPLGEKELTLRPLDVTAGFQQNGHPPLAAVDGRQTTGWAIHPQMGVEHWLVLPLAEPIRADASSKLKVEIDQNWGDRLLLGRFRISAAMSRVEQDAPPGKDPAPAAARGPFATEAANALWRKYREAAEKLERQYGEQKDKLAGGLLASVERATRQAEAAGNKGDALQLEMALEALRAGRLPPSEPPKAPRLQILRGAVEFRGHRYFVIRTPATWHGAREKCMARGGHLVRIDDEAERQYIAQLIRAARVSRCWTDANDELAEGRWTYSNGEPIRFPFWQSGQPDNAYGGTEHFVELVGDRLNDRPAGWRIPFVCEWGDAEDAVLDPWRLPASAAAAIKDFRESLAGLDDTRQSVLKPLRRRATTELKRFQAQTNDEQELKKLAEVIDEINSGPETETGESRPGKVPIDAVLFQGHHYKRFEQSVTRHQAEAYCELLGGHLVRITSAEENEFVHRLIQQRNRSSYYFIDGCDEDVEGQWKYSDGKAFAFEAWRDGEPQNNEGIEHSLVIGQTANWADVSSGSRRGFVCEWEP